MANLKLGRKAVKTDSRTLKLAKYTLALPAAPATCDWTKGITAWGAMLNDQLGDCTIAGCGHAIQVCGVNVGYSFDKETLPDGTIESAYSAWDGYVPGDPSTDVGGVELDVLNDFKRDGLGGHHLIGFADPAVSNQAEIHQAIYLFGGCYIGFNVPNFIMSGDGPPAVWDVVADDGGIDGGHCVFCCGYDASTITFISWGSVYKMTTAFWNKYVDEAHALLLATWIDNDKTPSGFNLAQMEADLALIK